MSKPKSTGMMDKVAVVILNWNGRSLLDKFLPSVFVHSSGDGVDIVVADNGSTDDSLFFLKEKYPDVRLIDLKENFGFAKGYNKALAQIDHEYAILLNSDVEVTEGWLSGPIAYMDKHPEVAAMQPKIRSYNDKSMFEYAGAAGGYIDRYGYPFCRGRIFSTIEKDDGQYDDTRQVFWTSGACMFVRLKEFKEAGGFDESFFAHQEEIDLCWRLNSRGKTLVYYPDSLVYHVGGATLQQEHPRKTYLNYRNNLLMLYKNLPEQKYRKVMRFRWFFDHFDAFRLFLSGKSANARSVLKARHDFCKLKEEYKTVRQYNIENTTNPNPSGIFNKSLLWRYYIGRKKTFNRL